MLSRLLSRAYRQLTSNGKHNPISREVVEKLEDFYLNEGGSIIFHGK
jgi:hypothetical protein